jgi:microcystin-dependent protein
MATPKIIADFETQLATSIAIGGTSFTLSSATDDDGVALPNGLYYFTVDNGTSNKEYFAGTLTGTSVASVLSVSRQGTETSGAVRAHRIGASVIMTDFATYKKYMDEIALVSAPDGSTSAKGVFEASTLAEVRARTATGATGAALAVTPDVLDDLPTQAEKTYLTSVTGTIAMYAGTAAPSGFLLCDGAAVSRATYASLFAITSTTYGVGDGVNTFNVPNLLGRFPLGYAGSAPTKVLTFASRSGNVITVTGADNHAHNELQTGQAIFYATTGSVITGLSDDTTYYVVRVSATTFSLATSVANANEGTVITLSGDGTGTQTFTITYTARPLAQTGGEEIHSITNAQMPSHTHTVPTFDGNAGGSAASDTTNESSPVNFITSTSAGSDTPHNNMPLFTVVNYIIKT